MSGFGEKILCTEGLLKQISCGNKIIAEIVHECTPLFTIEGVLSILSNAVCQKCIPNILAEVQSKSAQVRARVTEYMSIIADTYPDDILERYIDYFAKSLKKSLPDADPQARNFSRSTLSSLSEKFPDEMQRLVSTLDPTTRKQIAGAMNTETAIDSPSPISKSLKRPPSKKVSLGGKQQPSVHDDEESITKDSSKMSNKLTPNTKDKTRTMSAMKRTNSRQVEDTPIHKPDPREERKKSVNTNKVKDRSSLKSVEPNQREFDPKSASKTVKNGKGAIDFNQSDFKDILVKLDHAV
jgi:hypothetical protein